jgi:hypothetical protein
MLRSESEVVVDSGKRTAPRGNIGDNSSGGNSLL